MSAERYVGLMSGTSVDGVDGVLVDFSGPAPRTLASRHRRFPDTLRAELQRLQASGADEIHRAALAANALMGEYAEVVSALLQETGCAPSGVAAIGAHGQTVRHRPDCGYTTQLANPSLLAERTGIAVVADFRRRDVAAGGQGAPLAPALHAALFGPDAVPGHAAVIGAAAPPGRGALINAPLHRVVLNLGGIANLTDLPPGGPVTGFDVGPANTLLDAWCEHHRGERFDRDGAWARTGQVVPALLARLADEAYFTLPAPKSTGRDLFNLDWLEARLDAGTAAVDVQRTLVELTASTIARALERWCDGAAEVLACGGGAHNAFLLERLQSLVHPRRLTPTSRYGVPVDEVEAFAFAWLARETLHGRPGNVPSVTGARGPRVIGGVYPA